MAVTDYNANTDWDNEQRYLNNLIAQGGGNAEWAKKQMVDLNAAKSQYNPSVDLGSLGSVQNVLDQITRSSDKVSARSLEYAQQQQDWSASQAQIANNFNAAEAAKNRDWQTYMSNTAHQREVADLKAAGLNPVLSATGGNGAAVTSGSSASAAMPSGSKGEADNSANAALVSILGSLISAQTSLANTALSARTNEAIADKNNATSQLVASIAASASKYGYDMSYKTKQDFPDSWMQLIDSILSGNGSSPGSIWQSYYDGIDSLVDGVRGLGERISEIDLGSLIGNWLKGKYRGSAREK